jgi:hypothetical protein
MMSRRNLIAVVDGRYGNVILLSGVRKKYPHD